jgi:hypothetical protein
LEIFGHVDTETEGVGVAHKVVRGSFERLHRSTPSSNVCKECV